MPREEYLGEPKEQKHTLSVYFGMSLVAKRIKSLSDFSGKISLKDITQNKLERANCIFFVLISYGLHLCHTKVTFW